MGESRHEFGHAVGLNHVVQSTVMYYLTTAGGLPAQIQNADQNGGIAELNLGPVYMGTGCYSPQLFPSGCPTLTITNGITNIANNPFGLSVYPNPVDETITVSATLSQTTNIKVSIFDVLGQIITEQDYGDKSGTVEESINVSSLSAGMYLVQVTIGNQNSQVKLIKK